VMNLSLCPQLLLKFVMCRLLPSLVSIIEQLSPLPCQNSASSLSSKCCRVREWACGSASGLVCVREWACGSASGLVLFPHENFHLLAPLSARSSSAAPSSVCSFTTSTPWPGTCWQPPQNVRLEMGAPSRRCPE
jgi:hypothetical protein